MEKNRITLLATAMLFLLLAPSLVLAVHASPVITWSTSKVYLYSEFKVKAHSN